jgi:hypothetical protein
MHATLSSPVIVSLLRGLPRHDSDTEKIVSQRVQKTHPSMCDFFDQRVVRKTPHIEKVIERKGAF